MKKRKVIAFTAIGVLAGTLAIHRGLAIVRETVAQYDGACGELSGFPGMLQKAGFFDEAPAAGVSGLLQKAAFFQTKPSPRRGTCKVQANNPTKCASPGSKCFKKKNPSDTEKNDDGICRNTKFGCVCVDDDNP